MKTFAVIKIHLVLLLFCLETSMAQITPNVYLFEDETNGTTVQHELKIDNGYFVYSKFKSSPPEFISTMGGFYTFDNDSLKVKLEFNSNYENDAITELSLPCTVESAGLNLNNNSFVAKAIEKQDLDGQWLFATRGPDTGQERRGDSNARKTLKFLLNGHFQWIAYHTETFKFSGTGGGTFTSADGKYVENIRYFSRDNNRVGASLSFDYELKGDDWHHQGKNSKGAPMYEIWARRN